MDKRASSMPVGHDPSTSALSSADDRIAYEMNGAPLQRCARRATAVREMNSGSKC